MNRKQIFRFFVIIFCLYLIVTTVAAIADMSRAGSKLTDREIRLAALKKEQENLLKQKAVTEKPGFWEKVARDQLGLARPGEEIIIIPPELLASPSATVSVDATPNWQKWGKLLF